jgi:outer membrane protein OmpA-like peptidoglycan-associated protein
VSVQFITPVSSNLTAKLKSQISDLASYIKTNGDSKVVLFGFSDATGSKSQAVSSSKRRASAIARYLRIQLERIGVTSVNVKVVALGSSHPIASNSSSSGRALNRRVVVRIS